MAIAAIRTILIYALLIAAMRVMGRRQLGELQPIELVVTLLISDLASVPMQDSTIPLMSGIIPIFVLVAAEILFSAWMFKSPKFSALVSGKPMLVMNGGVLDQQVLKKLRMTVEDLTESLRGQGIFDLRDVQAAIAETNGTITVYPTAVKRPVVLEDLGRTAVCDHGMPLVIAADGTLCDWAIEACGLDNGWIARILQTEGCTLDDVMVMTANASKDYHIIKKEVHT